MWWLVQPRRKEMNFIDENAVYLEDDKGGILT